MYCPGCGSEERHASQFCRACGTDLGTVRNSLERHDAITASAVTAREEIGRAIAEKIRQVDDSRDLRRVAKDVLPQIEKFLESPAEKRLRRLRAGMITALVGLGFGIPALVFTASNPEDRFVYLLATVLVLSTVTFFTGLGMVINGLLFTRPNKQLEDKSSEVQNLLDSGYVSPQLPAGAQSPSFRSPTTSNLKPAPGLSVTDQTTRHLKNQS